MLMTVEDLEKESKVSQFTWRTWIREKRIASIRLGRRVRVDREDFLRFMAANRVPARDNGQ